MAYPESNYLLKAGGFGSDAVVSWPVQIAQHRGFFAAEGIQAELVRTYSQMMALIGGSFDVIADGVSSTALAIEKGADISVVYDLSRHPAEFIVLGRGLKTLDDIENKTMAVGRIGTTPHLFVKKYFIQKS